MIKSLTSIPILGDPHSPIYNQLDHSVKMKGVEIEVIFRNHKNRLLELIGRYPYVVGCVAWLTDFDVLSAMADMEHVSIVVQKEDFLRPDLNPSNRFADRLREAYMRLPNNKFHRLSVNGIVSDLSIGDDLTIDPVRCMGNHNSNKSPAFPRMHNKFLVFTDNVPIDAFVDDPDDILNLPNLLGVSNTACVWTGSYNISETATKSLENAVIIQHEIIAQAYFSEWSQILALSEPLDWESEWCAPQWRIGT
jgi:phosphatidylserine/phosphatidylglycerophosphate/cardiolipin synthase-like enzyme